MISILLADYKTVFRRALHSPKNSFLSSPEWKETGGSRTYVEKLQNKTLETA